MFELKDKVAIVTGGARGIGKGICLVLAKQGANIAIADLLEKEARETLGEIEKLGRKALFLKTDITVKAQVEETVKKVVDTFFTVSSTCAFTVMSVFKNKAFRPNFSISPNVSRASFSNKSAIAMFAPCFAKTKHIPLPIPLAPPVTIATLSFNSNIYASSFIK